MCKICGIPGCKCRKVVSKQGERGKVGPRGPKGDKGDKGDPGVNGSDGADGIGLDIVSVHKNDQGVANPAIFGVNGYDILVLNSMPVGKSNIYVWGRLTFDANDVSTLESAPVSGLGGVDGSRVERCTLSPVVAGKTSRTLPIAFTGAVAAGDSFSIRMNTDSDVGATLKTAQLFYILI